MAALGNVGQWARLAVSRYRGPSRWPKLVALCIGLNVVEAGLVAGLDHGSRPYLAPQASAIAPFGVFSDLRWVSVYHDSMFALAAELLAMLVVRGTLTAISVYLAWPENLRRPPAKRLVLRGVLATALATILLSPSVAVLFSLAFVPVSWLFFAAVPTALLVAFILHPAAVSGDWWQRLVAPRAVGWVALAFVVLSLASAVMAAVPVALWPIVAAISGLFNAWSWVGLVRAVADRRPVHRLVPVAAIAALAMIGVVGGGTALGFNLAKKATASPLKSDLLAPATPRARAAVLVVSGYGSIWEGQSVHPFPGDFVEERFSYNGLGPTGEPLPYAGADTAKSVFKLDRMLLAQVASLHAQTGLPVDVVAESEGALVAKTALLASPSPWVAMLVLASPLEDPGRVWYPTTGNQGWGIASSDVMELISGAFQGVAPINLSPDNPLFVSLDQQAPAIGKAMSCPIPGIRQFALLPLADATVTPAAETLSFPSVVLPAFHGGLLQNPSGERVVSRVLTDHPVTSDRLLVLAEEVISDASSAWQVPSLVASDYPGPAGRPTAGAPANCNQVATELRTVVSLLPSRGGPEVH
jgi:hypothetical protein